MRLSLVLAAFLSLAVLGCTRTETGAQFVLTTGETIKLAKSETLRVMVMSEPPTLDWHKASDHTSVITDNFMEGLVQYDYSGRGLQLAPALAVKWGPSEEGRIWKFQLRDDVKWSDGQAFKAQHVLDGIKRLLAKETDSPYAHFLFALKNAEAFHEGRVSFEQVGVKAAGSEVIFELKEARADFPFLLTHASTFPVRFDVVEKFGAKWTEAANIVTLGPYVLKAWKPNEFLWLERNEKYYGAEKAAVKHILVRVMPDLAKAVAMFEAGELDAVHNLSTAEAARMAQRSELRRTSTMSVYYFGFNVDKKPVDNVNVRKAIVSAIDQQEVVKLLGAEQLPLRSWVPPGVLGYSTQVGLPFHLQRAQEFLRLAKVKPEAVKLVLKFNAGDDNKRIAENIQAQLRKNLGITVEIQSDEWKSYLEEIKKDPPQMFRLSWNADYPDPNNFFSVLLAGQGTNRTRWKNARYDELVARGAHLLDPDQRREVYAEAQKILLEEQVPVLPLFTGVHQLAVAGRVENYPVNALLRYPFRGVRVSK